MRKFIVCSFALLSAIVANAQPVKIAVKKGQQFKVETSTQMKNSSNNSGEVFESSSESTDTYIYKITDVSKNEIGMEFECTRIVNHTKVMNTDMKYDSDKKDTDNPMSKTLSKKIGKQRKLVLDLTGKIIKEDKPEKDEDAAFDMSWLNSGWLTPLFIPELIGKNYKEGDSIPVANSYFKEKPSTSFSFSKESFALADTGTFIITAIRDGIASLSYTGFEVLTLSMKMNDMPVHNISNVTVKTGLSVDMNTGIVVSSTRTDVTLSKPTSANPSSFDMTSTITTKITQLE